MLILFIETLLHYLPIDEVKRYYYGDAKFEVEVESCIPILLHTWVGENHEYREEYHEVFVIPEQFRIPLIEVEYLD